MSEVREQVPDMFASEADPPEAPADKPKQRCVIARYITESSLAIIKAYPQAESSRAIIMSVFGQMPPKEADTWTKVKDWVETTFDGPMSKAPPVSQLDALQPAVAQRPTQPAGIQLLWVQETTELYTQRFRRSYIITGEVQLTDRVIEEIIGESDNMEEVTESIESYLRDALSNGDLSLRNEDRRDHEDVAVGEEDNHETEEEVNYFGNSARRTLRDYIQDNFNNQLEDRGIET